MDRIRLPAIAAAILIFASVGPSCASSPTASDAQPSDGTADNTSSTPADLQLDMGEKRTDVEPGPLLSVLSSELSRMMEGLSEQTYPPYHLSYQVTENETRTLSGSFGALQHDGSSRNRYLDVDVRVGSHKLDNTRELRGQWWGDYSRAARIPFPIDDDAASRRILWRTTDHLYQEAAERFVEVVANKGIKVPEDDESGDFAHAEPVEHIEPLQSLQSDEETWRAQVRDLSAIFADHRFIEKGVVQFTESVETRYQATSEGSKVRKVRRVTQLFWYAQTTAEDGMKLFLYDSVDAFNPADLPSLEHLEQRVQKTAEQLGALREAPKAEPFVGPAILEGQAAGVFFHEALGHRVEGHRQSDEDEGQTFAKKIDKKVLPGFLDIYDDPRLKRAAGTDLMGHYLVDDQAVGAERATIVDDGIFKGFLMSREPVRGFERSNGHGRRETGKHVVARQGNLIAHPQRTVSRDRLKEMLIEEIKAQDKPYGLRFVRVQGGYTLTGRWMPQSFKVLPTLVFRVYPDGREELLRGVTLEGTPLTVLSEIRAAADDVQIFNGVCGAESGRVPVSSVSPTLLVRRIETARNLKESERPPILSVPARKSSSDNNTGEAQ